MFLDRSHLLPARSFAKLAGVTVADLDHDGHFEFFVAASGGPNRLLKWTGSSFRDVIVPLLADAERDGRGAVAGDFDGDGREELYLLNEGPLADRLLDDRPAGWQDLFSMTAHRGIRGPFASRTAVALDRRGHGRYGFAVSNNDGALHLMENLEHDTMTDLAPALGIDLHIPSSAALVAPLASPRGDLFFASARGSNLLFRNTGLGTFLEVASEHGLADSAESSVACAAFDDGEGSFGLIVLNADGPHRLFIRRDDGTFRNVATPALAFPSDARGLIVADFDNDGYEELLIFHRGEPNRFFRQSALSDMGWSMVDPGPVGWEMGVSGAAVADIDRDGTLELLMTKGGSAPVLLKAMPNDNGWLRVRPTTRFGAPARGAVVHLLAGDRRQIRTVGCGSGSFGQHEPVAHFGLGSIERIEHIQVTWPDGTLARLEKPAIRSTIEMRYPGS